MRGYLKAEFTSAQLVVSTTAKKVLDVSREALASRDDVQRRLTAAAERNEQDLNEREMLGAELREATLKRELMGDWKKSVVDVDKNAAAAAS